MRRVLTTLFAWLCACGDNAIPADATIAPPSFAPAPHAPLPQVSGHSQTVLSSVRLVTITYQDDIERDTVEALGDVVVGSAWYAAVGDEYGVFAGSHAAKVHLGAAPATLSRPQIEQQIRTLITGHFAPRPTSKTDQLLYMFYVPPHVTLDASIPSVGYHDVLSIDGVPAPVAVVVDGGGDVATTTTAARLLINAATNPFGVPDDGYYADPPRTDPWSLAHGEVADLCSSEPPVPIDGAHQIAMPRVYSNRAATTGGSPCRPDAPDEIWNDVSAEPSRLQTVERGGTVTFHLTGWSTQPMPDWTIRIQTAALSDLTDAEMEATLTSDTINNDRSVTLTLRAPVTADTGQVGGVYVLSGPSAHPWAVGLVVQ